MSHQLADGTSVHDRHGGVWRVVGIEVASDRYLLVPNVTVNGIPSTGYSPFVFAPRALWHEGLPTWEATAYLLENMESP